MLARFAVVALIAWLGCGPQTPPPAPPQQPTYRSMPEQAFRRTYTEAEFLRMLRGEVVVPDSASTDSTEPPPPEFSMATPRAALLSFLLCYQQKNWARMLELIPDRYRAHMTAEGMAKQFDEPRTQEMMEQLTDAADGPIEEHGDKATLRYGDNLELVLVREGGSWKIRDLD